MPFLQIPERYKPAIKKLASLSDDAIKSLLTALSEVPLSINFEELIARTHKNVEGLGFSEVEELLEALLSLDSVKEEFDLQTNFISEINNAVSKGFPDLSESQQFQVQDKLVQLLDSDKAISLLSKIRKLHFDHERVYLNGKIITDIRPVFSSVLDQPPLAATISYILNITYRDLSDKKEFFVALDSKDIKQLREVIDRAENKAKQLKSLLSNAGVPHIDI
ncbi:hypothetical protein [Funiculus sociatus]|uniref:hypothetical protein n=1 Tax=Funiculus sociatus TaxID=450527 RepID=UPI003297A17F